VGLLLSYMNDIPRAKVTQRQGDDFVKCRGEETWTYCHYTKP